MQFMAIEVFTILQCLNDYKTKANQPLRKRLKKVYQEIKETKHEPRVWLTKWEARQSIQALKTLELFDSTKLINFMKKLKKTLIKLSK